MEVRIGKVKGREIKKNRDGSGNRLLLQVEISNENDVQTVEMLNAPGEDSNPVNETQVLILDIGRAFKVAVAGNDGIVPSMGIGEKKLYSISSGAIMAFIDLLNTGDLNLSSGDTPVLLELGSDGKAALSNASKDLLTLIEGLIDVVKAIITVGSPTQHVISPTSQTALENYKSQFQGLLKNGA